MLLLKQPLLQCLQLLLDGCHLEARAGVPGSDVSAATEPSSLRSTSLSDENTRMEWTDCLVLSCVNACSLGLNFSLLQQPGRVSLSPSWQADACWLAAGTCRRTLVKLTLNSHVRQKDRVEPHVGLCRLAQHELGAQLRGIGLRHRCRLQSVQSAVLQQPGSLLRCQAAVSASWQAVWTGSGLCL